MKKIAILSQNKENTGFLNNVTFSLFEMKDDKIIEIEREYFKETNMNYISLWIFYKQVEELYLNNVSNMLAEKLNRNGIKTGRLEDLTTEFPYLNLALQ